MDKAMLHADIQRRLKKLEEALLCHPSGVLFADKSGPDLYILDGHSFTEAALMEHVKRVKCQTLIIDDICDSM